MSIQSDFFTLATGIFSARVYPQVAPDSPVAPYCIYSRVVATEQATLATNGGTGNAINTRLQIDVWALSYSDAQIKAAALKAALKTWAVENVLLDDRDMYEPDTKLHRVMMDVSIWHT